MNRYLKFLLSNSSLDEGTVPRNIVLDTLKPSNYMETETTIHKPKFPVYAGTHTYGMGWMQGVYRGYKFKHNFIISDIFLKTFAIGE